MSTITQKLLKFVTVTFIGVGGLALPACQTNAGNGALIGGAAGAGLGALITHRAGGAVVGGAAGAITGALIGNSIDREQDRQARAEYVAAGEPYYWHGAAWYFVGYDAYHQPIYERRIGYDAWGRPVVERRVFPNVYPAPAPPPPVGYAPAPVAPPAPAYAPPPGTPQPNTPAPQPAPPAPPPSTQPANSEFGV